MKTESPFGNIRFEHEGNHLYFLPSHLIRTLEAERPTFVVGTRGTGKTTLLQALNWEERLRNPFLRRQLPKNPFSRRYIGVYLKLPWIQMEALARWITTQGESARGPIVATYIDLAWLELLSTAITELLAEGLIDAVPAQEHSEVEKLLKRWPEIRGFLFGRPPFTVADLGDAFAQMRRMIDRIMRSEEKEPKQILASLPLGQVGEIGRNAGRALAAVCNANVGATERKWHFKVCMDEAECLDEFQQTVLNTVVRLAEWPVFPIVSSVRLPINPTATLNPGLSLQKADRELIPLDEMTDKQFRQLVEGIASVRIQTLTSDPSALFDVRRSLGDLDINGLLSSILRDSASPRAKALLDKAKGLVRASDGDEAVAAANPDVRWKVSPPIYQAYLIEQLHLPWKDSKEERWKRRKLDSSDFRKRMVAAFLAICKEVNTRVPYASADMVLQMSDHCVRDFLSQMDLIFVESGSVIKRFLQSTVPHHVQVRALWEASEKKRDILPSQVAKSPAETERLVSALAEITAFIQSHGAMNRHLVSNEQGRFTMRIPPPEKRSEADRQVLDLINEAAEAGYLRMRRNDEAEWEFQVHASLAAAYGFSYRGAQYPTPVRIADLDRLRISPKDQREFARIVRELEDRLAGEFSDIGPGPTLFDIK